ncbi:MAG: class I SAM-dependent methyltransferase [Planctomycetota bacterium]|jgi:SAM-dependent methyltransferase
MTHKGDKEFWENRYKNEDMPWDRDEPSPELVACIEKLGLTSGKVLEVGCGTGTNAIWMAEQGLEVTALDIAPTVVAMARDKVAKAGVTGVEIMEGDFFAETPFRGGDFDFAFDRGAFHHHADLAFREAFAEQVHRSVKPSAHWLTLCGSTDDTGPGGPPRLKAADIVTACEPWFLIQDLHALELERSGEGRLGWSCLMKRREG